MHIVQVGVRIVVHTVFVVVHAQHVQHTLIAVVSELTGYPEDMLGLDMDIEADLGIDSIKRVEILSAMEERMPDLPQVTPDMVGTLKTLGQICIYLSGTQNMPDMETGDSSPMMSPSAIEHAPSSDAVPRQIIDVVGCPKMPGRRIRIESGRWIAVIDDGSAMARSIVSQLAQEQLESDLPGAAGNADRGHSGRHSR